MKLFKRLTAILMSVTMILSVIPPSAFAEETTLNKIITFDGKSVKVTVKDSTAALFAATYEQNGSLKSVEMFKFDKEGEHIFTLKNEADKAMLWSKDMQPYDCKEVKAAVPTPTPTTIPKSTEITFDRTTYPLYVGNKSSNSFDNWDGYGSDFTLNASVNSEKYSQNDIVWSISDDSIAGMTVSTDKKSAKIQGRRTGFATVTAALPNGETAYCCVSVIDNSTRLTVNRIELNADALTIETGKSAELIPILYPKDIYDNGMLNKSLVWSSSDNSVAEVSNGTVTAKSSGTAVITATSADIGRTAQCKITVTDSVAETAVNGGSEIIDMTIGESKTLVSTDGIVWRSDNSYIADVDENGIVTAYSNSNVQNVSSDGLTVTETAGTVKIYATAVNGGQTAEYEIRVANSDIGDEYLKTSDGVFGQEKYTAATKTTSLSIAAKDIDVDEVYQIIPEADGDSKLLWICSSLNTATLDREGNVQGYKPGTVKIYAVAEDSLTDQQISEVKELQLNRELGESMELSAILENAVYAQCELTVKNSSEYLRNVHIAQETITDNSVNILWNRAALNHIPDFKEYRVYVNGEETAVTTALGYTVNDLAASTDHIFTVSAFDTENNEIESSTVTVTTKAPPTAVINVLDYGAKGNGKVLDTYAIQKAINDCPENGMVYLPAGYVFYSGALFLKSNMTFKVDGIIIGSIDPKDYPRQATKWEGWRKTEQSAYEWSNTTDALPENHMPHASLINAGKYDEGVWGMTGPYNIENLVICGDGQINANGFSLSYNEGPNHSLTVSQPYPVQDPTIRGRAITIHNGRNIYMKDITVAYSPSWTVHTINCDNITFDGMEVVSQGNGNIGNGTDVKNCGHIPNGDGIDPESCTDVNMFNVFFSTGDDAVAMKTGRNKEGNVLDKPNAYVRITDCTSSWSLGGFGTGSENAGGAHDLLFQNIHAENVRFYGIWLKTTEARGGITENVQIRDMTIRNANSAICINHDYPSSATNPADSLPVVRHVSIENISSGGTSGGIRVTGLKNSYITDIKINNYKAENRVESQLKYCGDLELWDCENTEWRQSSCTNINEYFTAVLKDTGIRKNDIAYYVQKIEGKTVTVKPGTTGELLAADIASALGSTQTYRIKDAEGNITDSGSVVGDGYVLSVTSPDGSCTAEYTIQVREAVNADITALSIRTDSGKELIYNDFSRAVSEYHIKAEKTVSSISVAAVTDDSGAETVMKNNGEVFSESTALTENGNIVTVEVTSSDGAASRTYTIYIDNSYDIAEDFSDTADDAWGFSGSGTASVRSEAFSNSADIEPETLKLNVPATGRYIARTFDSGISSARKLEVSFDWQSNSSLNGRSGKTALRDSDGEIITGMYNWNNSKGGIYFLKPGGGEEKSESFSRKWYTVSVMLDFESGVMNGTITEHGSGKVVKEFIDEKINAKNLADIYAESTYGDMTMSIDNVYVKILD